MTRNSSGKIAMSQMRIDLRVVFYEEDGVWFAHCLEMDVLGHGATKNVAAKELRQAIILQIEESVKSGNLANIFMPADAQIFEMYSAGRDIARASCEIEEQIAISKSARRVIKSTGFTTREFSGGSLAMV